VLLQTQFESARKYEREILEDTRNEMRLMVSTTNKELELKADKLHDKNNEINMLTAFGLLYGRSVSLGVSNCCYLARPSCISASNVDEICDFKLSTSS
jgi:hypothetical protein